MQMVPTSIEDRAEWRRGYGKAGLGIPRGHLLSGDNRRVMREEVRIYSVKESVYPLVDLTGSRNSSDASLNCNDSDNADFLL